MKTNLKLPLLCSSLVFFIIAGIFVGSGLRPFVRFDTGILTGLIPALLGIVSLAGTLVVLREVHDTSEFWFLGIPHVIVLITVCYAGLAFLVPGKHMLIFAHFPRLPGIESVFIPTALLSLSSIGFFLSFLGPGDRAGHLFMTISGFIGIFAVIGIYYAIRGIMSPLQTSWNVVTALEGIYWMFLMPIIGLCFLAAAFLSASGRPAAGT